MSPPNALIYALAFLLAVGIDLIIIFRWRKRAGQPGMFGKSSSPPAALNFLQRLARPLNEKFPFLSARLPAGMESIGNRAVQLAERISWGSFLELALIALWAAWVSSPLLETPPSAIPLGGEFSNLTQTHFIWTLLPRCGLCFLWNGSINGGAPAFAELTGAVLHPLVFIPVLLWGVVQGAKVTYFASLALAGMAQWKLARVFGLSRWPRVWSGLLVVVGGHLSGKMENGDISLVLGLACAALALAYGVDLLYNRSRASLVWFAAALALTLLSGEGYIQIATVLTLLPVLALLCLNRASTGACQPAWKDYLLALGLAVLLGGIFLAPLLHFLPHIAKDSDASLGNFPPLEYLPLNLVVRDLRFHRTAILGKDPYLATHMIYIGWAPVLLALLALRLMPSRLRRLLWVFFTGIALVFLVTSIDLPRALIDYLPAVGLLRHLTVSSGMVVPLIVGLAATSLDELLRRLRTALYGWSMLAAFPAPWKGLLAALPGHLAAGSLAVLSIYPCFTLSQEFLRVRETGYLSEHVQVLRTPTAQWVQPPYGFYEWTPLALASGMKIGHTWRPWRWEGLPSPSSYISAVFLPDYSGTQQPFQTVEKYAFFLDPDAEYAFVDQGDGSAPIACRSVSQGGWIDVDCNTNLPGFLTVRENAWPGWYAWIDGKPIRRLQDRWLRVPAPAGKRHYTFRYLPWDVPLGAAMTLAGMALSGVMLYRIRRSGNPAAK